jgi:hypothetical protein
MILDAIPLIGAQLADPAVLQHGEHTEQDGQDRGQDEHAGKANTQAHDRSVSGSQRNTIEMGLNALKCQLLHA